MAVGYGNERSDVDMGGEGAWSAVIRCYAARQCNRSPLPPT